MFQLRITRYLAVICAALLLPLIVSAQALPEDGTIAFEMDGQIYVIGADGENLRQTTRDGGRNPVWSSDGDGILFIAEPEESTEGTLSEITSELSSQVTREQYSFFAEANTIVNISLTAEFDTYLYLYDEEGFEVAFDDDGGDGVNSSLEYSVRETGTYVIEAASFGDFAMEFTEPMPYTLTVAGVLFTPLSEGAALIGNPSVIDMTGAIVTAYPDITGDFVQWAAINDGLMVHTGDGLFLLPPDADPVHFADINAVSGFAWSPDGSSIVWADGSGLQVLRPQAQTAIIERLTDNPADRTPTWSPDGERIAFERDDAIYMLDMTSDDENEEDEAPEATIVTLMATCPAWSPDGSALAFISGRSGTDGIYIISVDGVYSRRVFASKDNELGCLDWTANEYAGSARADTTPTTIPATETPEQVETEEATPTATDTSPPTLTATTTATATITPTDTDNE